MIVNQPMDEYDCVRLAKAHPDFDNVPVGTTGVIVTTLGTGVYWVEFFDTDDQTIDVHCVTAEYLELIQKCPPCTP